MKDTKQKKKWYQKMGWIMLLLLFCFPVGFFLMWRHTKWNKVIKTIFSGIFGFWFLCICIAIAFPTPAPEKIVISADTEQIYDINDEVEIVLEAEPEDCYVSKSAFQVSGGKIGKDGDVITFTSDVEGEFDIYVEESEVVSNTITLKFEDKEAIEQAERERIAEEEAEKQRIAEEEAEKERLKAEQEEKERLAAEQAEKQRIAEEKAEKERLAAEQAEKERIAEEKRIAEEQAKIQASTAEQTSKSEAKSEKQIDSSSQAPTSQEAKVWLSATGEKYHSKPDCGRMNPDNARQVTLSEAQSRGFKPCQKCY